MADNEERDPLDEITIALHLDGKQTRLVIVSLKQRAERFAELGDVEVEQMFRTLAEEVEGEFDKAVDWWHREHGEVDTVERS